MMLAITQLILVGISSCVVAQLGNGNMVANVTERSYFSPYGYPQQGYPPFGSNVGYPQQQGNYFPGQNQGQQYPQPGNPYYPQQQYPQQQLPQQQYPQQQYPQQQFPQQQFPQQQYPQQQFPQQQYPQQPYPQQPYPQQPYPQVPVPGLAPTTGTGFIRPPTVPGNATAPTTAATATTTTTTTARPLQPGVVTAYPLGAGVGFGRPNNNAILPGGVKMSARCRNKHHLVPRFRAINMRPIFVVTLALQVVLCSGQLRFDGDEVLRIFAKTPEEAAVLKNFTDKLDFWTRISKTRPTDVRVPSAEKINLREKLDSLGIKYEVFIDDVEKYVRIEARSQIRSAPPGGMDWTSYHSLGEIHNFMTEIAEQNNDIASIFDIGTSTEGRALKLIRIGYPSQGKKAGYFIDGGIHAREWATPAVTTYFINELLTKRSENDALLKSMDFYIIPSLNPDGYEYSRTRNRMWRKTRSNHLNGRCAGVDPNRNYDEHFGGDGTSSDTCSEIFRGPHAFSEPETAAVKNFITSQANDVDWLAYTAMHSYSQVILTPWGWGDEFPRNYKELKRVGDKAAAAIKAVHGKIYEVGSVTELMYAAAGGSDDWAHRFHFPYAYTIEVRDTGRYGFLLPANQILPCARENFQAIKVIAEEALKSRH